MLQIALAALLGPACPAANTPKTSYQLRVEKVKRVQAVLTMKIEHPNLKAKEWNVYVPVAPQLTGQKNVRTHVSPGGDKLVDFSPLKRTLLESTTRKTKDNCPNELTVRVSYKATLYSRKLQKMSSGNENASRASSAPKNQRKYLASFGSINYRSLTFQNWLRQNKLTVRPSDTEIDVARRVFLLIRAKFTYVYHEKLNRKAWYVCQTGKSDCGGLSVLFAAAMRANNVPTRVLYGRWARSSDKKEKVSGVAYTQSHVVAEFYANGVGWVPVDLASAILYDKTKSGLKYFGNAEGNFITQHIDPEMGVKTRHFGKRIVHSLQRPAYMISGDGSLEPTSVTVDWKVRTIK